jgi:hypothetical protein
MLTKREYQAHMAQRIEERYRSQRAMCEAMHHAWSQMRRILCTNETDPSGELNSAVCRALSAVYDAQGEAYHRGVSELAEKMHREKGKP